MREVARLNDGKRHNYKTLTRSPAMLTEGKPALDSLERRRTHYRSMLNPRERLTPRESREAFKLYRAEHGGYKKLGRQFDGSANVVCDVVLGLQKYGPPGTLRKRS